MAHHNAVTLFLALAALTLTIPQAVSGEYLAMFQGMGSTLLVCCILVELEAVITSIRQRKE